MKIAIDEKVHNGRMLKDENNNKEKPGGKIISGICLNCSGSGREKCWNCDGAGGKWKEIEGEFKWEKCSLCWGDGGYSCINCRGTGVSD